MYRLSEEYIFERVDKCIQNNGHTEQGTDTSKYFFYLAFVLVTQMHCNKTLSIEVLLEHEGLFRQDALASK